MITSDLNYEKLVEEIKERKIYIEAEHKRFKEIGLTDEQVTLALEPYTSFLASMEEDALAYQKAKDGEFRAVETMLGIGEQLIACRIYRGITQSELAKRIGVTRSQISKDEKNAYYGSSIEKIQKVLDALDMSIKIEVKG